MVNFWSFILSAVQGLVSSLIIWLFGGPENYHHAIGFQSALGTGVGVFFDVLFSTFGLFNLALPAVAIALFVPLWLLKQGINIWLLIRKVFLVS